MFFGGHSVVFLTGVSSNDNAPMPASPPAGQPLAAYGFADSLHFAPEFGNVPAVITCNESEARLVETGAAAPSEGGAEWWRPLSGLPQLGWRDLWLGSLIIGLEIVYRSGPVTAAPPVFNLSQIPTEPDAPSAAPTALLAPMDAAPLPAGSASTDAQPTSPALATAAPDAVYTAVSFSSAAADPGANAQPHSSSTPTALIDPPSQGAMTFSANVNVDPTAPQAGATAAAAAPMIVVGTAGHDILVGGAGNDVLVGGAGADLMIGGGGNDTFVVDYTRDSVVENAGEGQDTVLIAPNFARASAAHDALPPAPVVANVVAPVVDVTAAVPAMSPDFLPDAVPDTAAEMPEGIPPSGLSAPLTHAYAPEATGPVASCATPDPQGTNSDLLTFVLADNVENVVSLASEALRIIGNCEGNVIIGNGHGGDIQGGDGDDYIFADLESAIAVAALLPHEMAPVAQTLETAVAALAVLLDTPIDQRDLAEEAEKALDALLSGSGKAEDRLLAASTTLSGGAGNDVIGGSHGNDMLHGGLGHDVFVFKPYFGHDVIDDFGRSDGDFDMIFFADDQFKDLRDLTQHMSQIGDDVLIVANDSSSLLIKNTQKMDLATNDHFVFL